MRNKNRIVVCNGKGGVGKTTSVIEIAAELSNVQQGRLLVIDIDPSANSTLHLLGYIPKQSELTISNLLLDDDLDTKALFRKATSAWPNTYVIPSNETLNRVPALIEGQEYWINLLDENLETFEHNFDYILIDTPPLTNALTKLALRAANKLLIPTDISEYSDSSDNKILALVKSLEKKGNHKLDLVKLVMTMQQKGNSFAVREAIQTAIKEHGDIFDPVFIPHTT